jgi:hypothetical protein
MYYLGIFLFALFSSFTLFLLFLLFTIFFIISIYCFLFLANEEGSEEAYIEDVLDMDKIALEQIQEGEERVEELTDENEKKNENNNEIIANEKSDLDNAGAKSKFRKLNVLLKHLKM